MQAKGNRKAPAIVLAGMLLSGAFCMLAYAQPSGTNSTLVVTNPFLLEGYVYHWNGTLLTGVSSSLFMMMICVDEDEDNLYWPEDSTDYNHVYSDEGMNGLPPIDDSYIESNGFYTITLPTGGPGGYVKNFKIWVNGSAFPDYVSQDGYCTTPGVIPQPDGRYLPAQQIFTFPASGASFSLDIQVPVGWFHYPSTATGPVGSSASANLVITYEPDCGCFGDTLLYYSNDKNSTWYYIGTEDDMVNEDGLFAWTAPDSGEYWWYAGNGYGAIADDPPGPGTPAEAGPYVITLPPPSFNIPVIAGWNLVSTPLVPGNATMPDPLLDYDGDTQWTRALWYDPWDSADHWKQYNVAWNSSMNDLKSVDNKMCIWLYVTTVGNGYIKVTGSQPSSTGIPLKAGWNLVGYPSITPRTASDTFWGTGADIVEVFDPAQPYMTKAVGPTYLMTPGKGYWVHVNADTVWTVDW
ncbi:MAG: hypothetical protein V1934_06450 [Methanobacteriota archaeon]